MGQVQCRRAPGAVVNPPSIGPDRVLGCSNFVDNALQLAGWTVVPGRDSHRHSVTGSRRSLEPDRGFGFLDDSRQAAIGEQDEVLGIPPQLRFS
jgi:hypothetical protein